MIIKAFIPSTRQWTQIDGGTDRHWAERVALRAFRDEARIRICIHQKRSTLEKIVKEFRYD